VFTSVATKEGINLYDNCFDWSVKAVAIKYYPDFFNFLKRADVNPFNKLGKFANKQLKTE
jgi:hypothetical protein